MFKIISYTSNSRSSTSSTSSMYSTPIPPPFPFPLPLPNEFPTIASRSSSEESSPYASQDSSRSNSPHDAGYAGLNRDIVANAFVRLFTIPTANPSSQAIPIAKPPKPISLTPDNSSPTLFNLWLLAQSAT